MHCRTCNQDKVPSDFYPSVSYKCKACILDYGRKWESSNKDKVKAKNKRTWAKHREKRILNLRKYRAIHGTTRSKNYKESVKQWRKNHPKEFAAHTAVYRAVKNGTLKRPESCSRCGKPCDPVGHHHDYSKPLDVVWVCVSCHRQIHWELNQKAESEPLIPKPQIKGLATFL